MLSPTRLIQPPTCPANTQFHVRLQLCVSSRHLPYVRPVVKLTTRNGARL